jgi:hypothetical protein
VGCLIADPHCHAIIPIEQFCDPHHPKSYSLIQADGQR